MKEKIAVVESIIDWKMMNNMKYSNIWYFLMNYWRLVVVSVQCRVHTLLKTKSNTYDNRMRNSPQITIRSEQFMHERLRCYNSYAHQFHFSANLWELFRIVSCSQHWTLSVFFMWMFRNAMGTMQKTVTIW